MNDKYDKIKKDDNLKKLLSTTKMKASENLRYRVMQQIETEQALSRKKTKSSRPVIGSMLTIFGIMYALIAIAGVIAYTTIGVQALTSSTFILSVVFISSICGLYWLITSFDERRKARGK